MHLASVMWDSYSNNGFIIADTKAFAHCYRLSCYFGTSAAAMVTLVSLKPSTLLLAAGLSEQPSDLLHYPQSFDLITQTTS